MHAEESNAASYPYGDEPPADLGGFAALMKLIKKLYTPSLFGMSSSSAAAPVGAGSPTVPSLPSLQTPTADALAALPRSLRPLFQAQAQALPIQR